MSKARKRQKIEHVSSDDDDDVSFASFSDADALEIADQEVPTYENDLVDNNDEIDGKTTLEAEIDDLEDEDDSSESYEEEELSEGEDTKSGQSTTIQRNGQESRMNGPGKPAQHRSVHQADPVGKSSIFNAQVKQLLQQIRPKHTAREVEAEEALHLIKSTIDTVPAQGPFILENARQVLAREKIVIPFPEPAPAVDSNLKFSYERPASVNIVGSYPMRTANRARKFLYIDMVAQMPSILFTEKDCLDYRYFHKRAFYLAVMASSLRAAHSKNLDIRFQCHHDDALRPIITIRPLRAVITPDTSKPTRNWQINILPAIAEDLFPSSKLLPNKNCIRKGRAESTATPSYNSSIRADMLVTAYLKLLHKASITCEAYKDACSIGSTWLRQRGFRATSRKGGIASFEWSALLALLLTGGGPGGRAVLSERWESTQLFKATLQFLASKGLVKQPVSIGDEYELESSQLELPIMWDAVRAHNIFHKLSIWSYKRLQSEAKVTLNMLGDQQFSGFEAAFIMRKDIELLDNDVVIELRIGKANKLASGSLDIYSKLYNVLRRGLGDRVKSIQLTAERSKPWELNSSAARSANADVVKIGLLVNPDTVNRAVDHGPSAEDKAASASFRKFWADKSELRRFKDGSITEALIWETGPGKPTVLSQVVRYVLAVHLGIHEETDVTFGIDIQAHLLGSHASQYNPAEMFKTLEQDVRSLEGLPLANSSDPTISNGPLATPDQIC